jgi:uncharacterized protein (DUF1697 family)
LENYAALLRGINVGGNSLLPMSALKTICEEIGFLNVRTYIQSGNVLFESEQPESILAHALHQALIEKKQMDTSVMIRTIRELAEIIAQNPFANADNAKVGVMFFAEVVPQNLTNDLRSRGREEVVISGPEIYIFYPDGMGKSKLMFPKMSQKGTVRNINTLTKLVGLDRLK